MRNLAHLSISLSLLISLGACSLAPEHHADASAVAPVWPEEIANLTTQDATKASSGLSPNEAAPNMVAVVLPPLTEDSWRNYFVEPPVQAVIASALANNRDLAVAVGRVAEARAQAGIADAERWPQIDLAAQRNATHIPATIKNNNSAGTTTQRYDVNLATSYELDFWGRVSSLDAAARANFLASDFARQAFRITLIADVATAWYTLEETQQREHLLMRISSTRKASLDISRQRGELGLASDLEVRAAEAAYYASTSELAAMRRTRMGAENTLRLLVGRELDPAWRPSVIAEGEMLPLPTFPMSAIGLPSSAILRRPDVQAAEQKLRAARANIGVARAAFLPRLLITASGGTASSALESLFTAGSRAWTFTPALRLPLFDAGHTADALDLAKARENIAVAEYERSVQQAFRDIVDILAVVRYGTLAVREAYRSADATLARYALVKQRYDAGVINTLELLDAERDMLNAQQQQVSTRRSVNANGAIFYKTFGGL